MDECARALFSSHLVSGGQGATSPNVDSVAETLSTTSVYYSKTGSVLYESRVETYSSGTNTIRPFVYSTFPRIISRNRLFAVGSPQNRPKRRRGLFFLGVSSQSNRPIMGNRAFSQFSYRRKIGRGGFRHPRKRMRPPKNRLSSRQTVAEKTRLWTIAHT